MNAGTHLGSSCFLTMAATTLVPSYLKSLPVRRTQAFGTRHNQSGSLLISLSSQKERILQIRCKPMEIIMRGEARKQSWILRTLENEDTFSDLTETAKSPADMIRQFYKSINGKDTKKLGGFFSEDCVFEDLAFAKPFQGVKEVQIFLKDLMAAMGDNVKFVLQNIEDGGESTAAVMWHLEWNSKTIPFTRGVSFFEIQRSEDKLFIKKAHVIVESPFKPGRPVLELLKIVTSLFDRFPDLAEKFLQKPYAAVQLLMKIYKITLEPLLLPLLIYYSQVWKLIINMIQNMVSMVIRIIQAFK